MHEFHSNVNKVNKAVAKVRTIRDRLPLRIFPKQVASFVYFVVIQDISQQARMQPRPMPRSSGVEMEATLDFLLSIIQYHWTCNKSSPFFAARETCSKSTISTIKVSISKFTIVDFFKVISD